jgi:hypothetical protein
MVAFNEDEMEVSDILLQLSAPSSKLEPCRNCLRVKWGIWRKRSNPLPKPFKDATQVSSSLTESQENMRRKETLKRKRESGDLTDDSDHMEAFNLGLKARKPDNCLGPRRVLDHLVHFDFLAPGLDMKVANIPYESLAQDFDLNKAMAAQARGRRFKICRAKNSIAGFGTRSVVPI